MADHSVLYQSATEVVWYYKSKSIARPFLMQTKQEVQVEPHSFGRITLYNTASICITVIMTNL